jgi:hypothetical protein
MQYGFIVLAFVLFGQISPVMDEMALKELKRSLQVVLQCVESAGSGDNLTKSEHGVHLGGVHSAGMAEALAKGEISGETWRERL